MRRCNRGSTGDNREWVTIATRAGGDREGVTGNSVAFHCRLDVATGTRQMAINTADASLTVDAMCSALGMILVTGGAEGICGGGNTCALGMDFVAVNARDPHLTVAARSPFEHRTRMASAAQLLRRGNRHTFLRMPWPVRAVTGLTGHARQHKLAGNRIIAGGMA
jgi:hypothetical protein